MALDPITAVANATGALFNLGGNFADLYQSKKQNEANESLLRIQSEEAVKARAFEEKAQKFDFINDVMKSKNTKNIIIIISVVLFIIALLYFILK